MALFKGKELTCEHCGILYRKSPSLAAASHFCSAVCKIAHKAVERRTIKCVVCNSPFIATQDHGKWPIYCSRDCFLAVSVRPVEKECEHCGSMFRATRSGTARRGDGYRLFCSKACSAAAQRIGDERPCLNCGGTVYASPSKGHRQFCSKACSTEYQQMTLSPAWKGGVYKQSGYAELVYVTRQDGSKKYIARHRLEAEKAIGRELFRHENVLRLWGPDDYEPGSLFICASVGEMRHRHNGRLPWPTSSNLQTYRDRV